MQFLKNHYEKVILSFVLLGLAVAAAFLPWKVSQVRAFLDEKVEGFVKTSPKPFEPVDLKTNQVALERLERTAPLEFAGRHNLFNPVEWRKGPDGRRRKIIKGLDGPEAIVVASINPLSLELSFDGVSGSLDNRNYRIMVKDESERRRAGRARSIKMGQRNEQFMLRDARPADNPTEVDLWLEDEQKLVTVGLRSDQKYSRVVGYSANLIYKNQTFSDTRKGDAIQLADDRRVTYKVVVIEPDEVVLASSANEQRIHLQPGSSPPRP